MKGNQSQDHFTSNLGNKYNIYTYFSLGFLKKGECRQKKR